VGKSCSSDEVIKKLKEDGWYLIEIEGDHHQFKHPKKSGKVTVPHPRKDLDKYLIASIKRQSGLKF
jgi:predicted RNA binding protein YcfA (HicA-like mRNA interferase family)